MSSFLRFVSVLVHMWVLTGRGHAYQRAVSFTFGEYCAVSHPACAGIGLFMARLSADWHW